MPHPAHEIWLIRPRRNEWSLSGAHIQPTDIPPRQGREQAPPCTELATKPSTSSDQPRARAQETAVSPGLDAERRRTQSTGSGTTASSRVKPHLRSESSSRLAVWKDNITDGETLEEVSARAEAVIERALSANGPVALFAHAHILRTSWPAAGSPTEPSANTSALGTASISVLGFERETRVILRWNQQQSVGHAIKT